MSEKELNKYLKSALKKINIYSKVTGIFSVNFAILGMNVSYGTAAYALFISIGIFLMFICVFLDFYCRVVKRILTQR